MSSGTNYRVLVADDDPNVRNDILQRLLLDNYEVDAVDSGIIAMDYMNSREYDLAFFSVNLFDMNGLVLTQIARENGKDFRIIIISDRENLETAIDAKSMGANDFIIQPFEDLKDINAVAYRALENKRLEEEKERLFRQLQQSNRELAAAKQEIEAWSHELERKVQERTYELEQSRRQIQKYAEELKRSNEELKQLDAMKTDFLANISHELKTPLTAILGYSEIFMMGDENNISPQFKEFASMINDSGKQLLTLITDILSFSEIERGVMELNLQPVHIHEIIEPAVDEIQDKADQKQIHLHFERHDEYPAVNADPAKSKLALLKLLDNAVKFTPEGGSVTIRTEIKGNFLWTHVRDTGIGIPADQFDVIFQRMRQGDGSSTREYGGLGVGLSMAKELIELHNGSITVESEVGRGSCFSFSLPLVDPTSDDYGFN
ncbi:MAG: hybrid sensor histidine kinase/response regulator [Gemmatimonadetes bacterium]|nr:MAG: hybrid sensor histidine kinase/response regulator [Gemmatimonadota bacterium]